MGIVMIIDLEVDAVLADLPFSTGLLAGLALMLQNHLAVRLDTQDIGHRGANSERPMQQQDRYQG